MRAIVKVFVVGTLGLAVLFASPGVSLALPKAGGVECNGPLDHLPPGKMCPKDFAETNLHRQDGTCEVHCCRDTPDGKLDCSAPPVDAKLKAPRSIRPNLPATIYEPPTSPPVGPRPPVTPGQMQR